MFEYILEKMIFMNVYFEYFRLQLFVYIWPSLLISLIIESEAIELILSL